MKDRLKKILATSVLLIASISYLYPWVYMIARSFMRHEPGMSDGNGLFTLRHYQIILSDAGFLRFAFNSVFVLFAIVLANIIISLMAGYALARYRFRLKKLLFGLLIITIMLPRQVLMIPLARLIAQIGLYNTLWALILPFMADSFNLLLVKQYIQALPVSLEDAARADGATEFQILRHVVYPLSKPVVAVIIINTSIITWNAFLFPLILTDTASARTLPVALSIFSQGPYATDWGVLMSGAVISSIPMMLIFWMFQKQIISGIIQGALKE